ncbi:Guanine nucleotide-binding protein alpha-3 subunit [Fusarium oxysporum f. sp. cubense race 1]|uniref:Guanine nucleotide-binding protein alpha-3 subunit n=1 Tax=Fusarium oxysporum f. sp. cubense (strain race 1) TaxID=1229664 RepID=N4V402_FUSC1|nr:Guanine nucleotide-binding protein alpha-3 subunit [Fusarium oxysporum f. sp. cubense race 1]
MRQAWKTADLTILAFENQLNLLKFSLCEIQKWAESKVDDKSHQLVMQVNSCVTCCRLLISKIDGEVSQLEKTEAGDLMMGSKISLLFKTKDMEQIQRMVDQQTHTLTLLLSACNANALEEQRKILQQPKIIRAFEEMGRDTASLIVHRDSDSVVTATSVSSSRWSVQFAFDRELFITKVYEKWIRKLATTRRTHSPTIQGEQQRPSDLQAPPPGPPTEQATLTRTQSVASRDSSRSSQSIGERITSLGRTAMSIELKPLNLTRPRSDSKLKARESRRIDQKLKDDSESANRQIKAVIVGSDTRKQVFEGIRRSRYRPEYYDKTYYRLIIFEDVMESLKSLIASLRYGQGLKEGDPLWQHFETILSCEEDLNPETGPDPEFAKTVGLVLEHPATKTLMERSGFVLPNNGKYDEDELFGDTELSEMMLRFEKAINSPFLRNSGIIVVLNNANALREKLSTEPLSRYFPEYTGGNDYHRVYDYIVSRLNQVNRAYLPMLFHLTTAVYDESCYRFLQAAIRELDMSATLKALNLA